MISPQMLAGIGLMILLVISHGYAYMKGGTAKENEHKAALLAAQQEAQEVERKWQGAANAIVTNLEAKRAGTQRLLDTALNGLRDRPERHLPNDPRANCAGASGAELSRPDAGFLVREATRAERLQAALDACYKQYDAVKRKSNGLD